MLLLAVGCGGDDSNQSSRTVTVDGGGSIEVTAREYAFDPDRVVVNGGGPLTIELTNDGDLADNTGPSGGGTGTSGPQATSRSIRAAQAGPVNADAPVRVLSDGDNRGPSGGGTAGRQSVTRSIGALQVGSNGVFAPIRVRSDGEDIGGTSSFPSGRTESATVRLRPGKYELLCTVGDHADLGMKGELEVK